MAQYTWPDPLPVIEPTALDNAKFGAALRAPSPALTGVINALDKCGTERVVVTLLLVGRTWGSPEERDEEQFQGYYFRSVVRNKAAMKSQLEGLRVQDPINRDGQRLLANAMIPPTESEGRGIVAGWAFREIFDEEEE